MLDSRCCFCGSGEDRLFQSFWLEIENIVRGCTSLDNACDAVTKLMGEGVWLRDMRMLSAVHWLGLAGIGLGCALCVAAAFWLTRKYPARENLRAILVIGGLLLAALALDVFLCGRERAAQWERQYQQRQILLAKESALWKAGLTPEALADRIAVFRKNGPSPCCCEELGLLDEVNGK